jgi:flagellar hook-associated protein 1 FlgK
VAHTFQQLYSRAEDVRTDTNNRITQAVSDVNAALKKINDLNTSIATQSNGIDTTDLEDQRDQALLQLGGLMDFTMFKQSNGSIAIYSKQGMPLLDHTVHPISVTGIGTKPAVLPDPPVVVIKTGSLGGLLNVRDTQIPQLEGQLDDMARALTQAFSDPPPPAAPPNGVGVELFNDGGGTTYSAASATGYARRISVNVAIRTNPELIRNSASLGDTTTIDRAVALFSRTDIAFTANGLPATGSLTQVATDFIAAQSSARQNAQAGVDNQTALKESFETKLSSLTGVNLDQEMAELIVFQQAYAANARMIQTAKDIVDDLMRIQ